MTATGLLFVRHGESTANAGGLTMQDGIIPLSPLGHAQASALALQLPASPSTVLCSPFLRTRETARPYVSRTGVEATLHDDLHEFRNFDHGLLEGMDGTQRRPIALAYWNDPDPDRRMGTGAETFSEFAARVGRFIHDELPRLTDGTVVFGHGRWIGMLLWQLSGNVAHGAQGMRDYWTFMRSLPMPNAAIYRIRAMASGQLDPFTYEFEALREGIISRTA